MSIKDHLFNVRKAAKFLLVTPKTIRTWAQGRILPGFKIGPRGDWRFTKNDLMKVIKGRKEVNEE